MKHIVAFSGGKDSQATLLWVKANVKDGDIVALFCDTGHEAKQTYDHIGYCVRQLDVPLVVVKGRDAFMDMVARHKRFPSIKARFCTEELKIKPMIDYILSIKEDVVIYQGIRKDESQARRLMKGNDEFFKAYIEGAKYAKYRKKEVLSHVDLYSVEVSRPVISWSAEDVMGYIKDSGMVPNELYFAGMKRVGCFPCVLCGHSEMKQMIDRFPDRITYIREKEVEFGRTFFPPNYIPKRFCSHPSGAPTIDDVVNYLRDDSNQQRLFDLNVSCMSHYNICE